MGGHEIDGVERAQIGKRTENEWIGLQSGIMDQMISALGERDHALLVDCRDYTTTPIPLPAAVRIVVCDSKQSRQLAHSAYNQRRSECETAVQLLQAALPSIQTLRDVSEAQLAAHAALLPPVIGQRARHVISENARVLQGVAALRRGDLLTFGRLMNEAHRSLRDDYAVSSVALDTLVAAAQAVPGVYGSRLTGAGFGGCTVSLVAPDAVETFRHAVSAAYEAALGIQPDIYVCRASAGARATHQLDDDDLA